MESGSLAAAGAAFSRPAQVSGGVYYVGRTPDTLRIGDLRISDRRLAEGPASFIGKQEPEGLQQYRSTNG